MNVKAVLTRVLTPDSWGTPGYSREYSVSTSNAMTRVKNRRSDAETTVYL